MTREIAIKVIKRMIKTGIAYDDGYAFEPLAKDEEKACGMAIKALEQEPCEDAVSKKDIYFKLTNGAYSNETIEQFIDRLVKELEALPPVNPQEPKTQFVEKSNFDIRQYNADLQSAYDCGKASQEPKTDVLDEIRADVQNGTHHFLDGEPIIEIKEVLQIIDKYRSEGRNDK